MTTTDQIYVMPDGQEDAARWEESRRRRRMLEGAWQQDLTDYLLQSLSLDRASNLGMLSRGINLFGSVVRQVATLYDREPTLTISEATDEQVEAFNELLDVCHLWQLAQRNNESCIGVRESCIKVEWSQPRETITLRLVPTDTLVVQAAASDPEYITEVREARIRQRTVNGVTKPVVTWDVWSIEDGGSFHILAESGDDITAEVLGEVPVYPYIDEYGDPYLPYVLYHAQPTGRLWDPYTWVELVDGALDVAVNWNLHGKLLRDASWAQKYAIDLELQGATVHGSGLGTSARVTTSPDSILMFGSRADRTGSAGVFQVAVEPDVFGQAVLNYQRTLVSTLGINPADIEKTQAAESGVAIQLKRSAQRRMAQRHEPMFRQGDTELLRKIALVHNTFSPEADLPVTGFSITYHPVEDGVTEAMERHALLKLQVEDGLMSRVEWYQTLHPESSFEDAMQALLENAAIAKALGDPNILRMMAAGQVEDKEDLVVLAAATPKRVPPMQAQLSEGDVEDEDEDDNQSDEEEVTNG